MLMIEASVHIDLDLLQQLLKFLDDMRRQADDSARRVLEKVAPSSNATAEELANQYDLANDTIYEAQQLSRMAYGAACVILHSAVEAHLKRLLKQAGAPLKARAGWEAIEQCYDCLAPSPIKGLHGYGMVDKMRIAANSFKHRGGRPPQERKGDFPLDKHGGIDYPALPWPEHINAADIFCRSALETLGPQIAKRAGDPLGLGADFRSL